jgi:acetyltransferase-like isoleucine patch superfamily enzyme
MIKKVIRSILAKIYMVGKIEADRLTLEHSLRQLHTIITYDNSTTITNEANIVNLSNDKSKIKIGNNCLIRGELIAFNYKGEISIGNFTFIGPGSKIWSACKVIIGDRVLISHNVNIHDNNAHHLDSKKRHEHYLYMCNNHGLLADTELNEAEINIGDDAWIGFNAIIFKGVTIGKGAIVGAGSLILKDVPDYAIVVGNPQRIIGYTQ